jgi:ATP-binding cassette subfamily C (CFTR/MRP) protein 4
VIFILTKKMSKEQEANESQTLLNKKNTSDDTDDQYRRQSSRLEWAESSWTRLLHVLCWWWLNPILSLGYKRQLTENDLGDIPHVDKTLVLLDRLHSYDWSSTTTWAIIYKEFGKEYIFASLFFLPFFITCIAQPLFLRQFIVNINDKQGSNTFSYLYVISLFISVIIQTFTERQAVFRAVRVGVRIRNSLMIIIYKHLLSLKTASWEQINTGQIINLIANDTTKFEQLYSYLGGLCGSILETIIIFGLLCWIIHPVPTMCGYALFFPLIIIQLYFSRKFGRCCEITTLCSDKRIQAFNEFIYGCHVVKMYNWEKPMEDRIAKLREIELASIRRTSVFRALNMTQYFISTLLLAFTTFGSAWLLSYPLNTANTFPALLFFASIRNNIMCYLPVAIEKLSEARFASKRIDLFMHLTMKQEQKFPLSTSPINQQQKGSIVMSNASFSWHDDIPCLSSLNLTIKQGTFVTIIGPVGSGKSSLLAAILGEMNIIDGQLNTNDSSFSYAAQPPWIFAETFRNNILLNRPFNEQRYRNVIHACCLDVDISLFGSSGDLTMIGENGVNLSGGQKARVGLARALYADADIYLLDDPLSAVDRIVAKQIYERCIGSHGLLKNKTRLLVTHQTQFLNELHQTIFLSHGHIDEQGCLNENILTENDINKNETSVLGDMLDENTLIPDGQSIITDETSCNDGVRWSVWYHLFTVSPLGIFGFCLLIVLLLLGEVLNSGTNYWLSVWLKRSETDQEFSPKFAYIYFGLIIGAVFADILRTNYYYTVALYGSDSLHKNMLRGLLYTSIQFYESNPSGRILNRVSKDQHVIDEVFPEVLLYGVIAILIAGGSMFIICFINPLFTLLLIVIVPAFWLIIRFYQRSSRQFKQLESITRSSVYALFLTSLNGLSTIRAFKTENSFIQTISERIDANTSAYIIVQAASQWFALRLVIVSSLILLATSVSLLLLHNQTYSSTEALSLVAAIYISMSFQWAVRKFSEADILIVSGERIDEYSHLPREEDEGGYKRLVKTSPTWPDHGTIEFRNYSLRHRFNLEYAIRNIDLHIESGQKIGIIGRTGTYYYQDYMFF